MAGSQFRKRELMQQLRARRLFSLSNEERMICRNANRGELAFMAAPPGQIENETTKSTHRIGKITLGFFTLALALLIASQAGIIFILSELVNDPDSSYNIFVSGSLNIAVNSLIYIILMYYIWNRNNTCRLVLGILLLVNFVNYSAAMITASEARIYASIIPAVVSGLGVYFLLISRAVRDYVQSDA